jgi:hypothetical protein
MTREYLREYGTYFHIAQTWGVYESTAYRIIRTVEDTLMRSRKFSLPGKKKLLESDHAIEVVVDVTESPIERPKKTKNASIVARKNDTPLKRKSL